MFGLTGGSGSPRGGWGEWERGTRWRVYEGQCEACYTLAAPTSSRKSGEGLANMMIATATFFLHAGDANVVSKSGEGLGKMMVAAATFFTRGRPHGIGKKKSTETMLLPTSPQAPRTSPLAIKAGGPEYRQAVQVSVSGRHCQRIPWHDAPEMQRRVRLV